MTKGRGEFMNKTWMSVFIAAFFEVCWVIGLKHADSTLAWGGTLFAIIISFYLMIMAGRDLAVGTVYAVFVGLGTAGTVLAEILLFDAPVILAKLVLIMILLSGVISLSCLVIKKRRRCHKWIGYF